MTLGQILFGTVAAVAVGAAIVVTWSTDTGSGGPPPARPSNLVVVSIDTLRADRLGCYGHPRPTSPTIDALARDGVVFEDASATSPWTKPSHASLFTGLYPTRHGAIGFEYPIADDVDHLASVLSQSGFQTAAVVASRFLTDHGLERGFAQVILLQKPQGVQQPSSVSDRAIQWLESRNQDKPFFLFVHYMDVHADYAALPRYREMFAEPYAGLADGSQGQLVRHALGRVEFDREDARHLGNLYDAEIRQVDDLLAKLFGHLEREGLSASTLLVLTSDHGEEFLEHGNLQHGFTQHQELIQIPLIFHGPGIPGATRIAEPVSLVDVMPTCLELLGVPLPEPVDGVALQRLWQEEGASLEPRLLYAEADTARPLPTDRFYRVGSNRAVRNERFRLHYRTDTGETQLFDLLTDPRERIDVKEHFPRVAGELLQELKGFLDSRTGTAATELSPEMLEAIRALGYAGDTEGAE